MQRKLILCVCASENSSREPRSFHFQSVAGRFIWTPGVLSTSNARTELKQQYAGLWKMPCFHTIIWHALVWCGMDFFWCFHCKMLQRVQNNNIHQLTSFEFSKTFGTPQLGILDTVFPVLLKKEKKKGNMWNCPFCPVQYRTHIREGQCCPMRWGADSASESYWQFKHLFSKNVAQPE